MMLLLGHRPPAHHATSYSRNDQTITITYLPTYHVKCQTSYLKSLYPALKLYQSTRQTVNTLLVSTVFIGRFEIHTMVYDKVYVYK